MITRDAQTDIAKLLEEFPAVGVLGSRQVGKTTLAQEIADTLYPGSIYLDLESPSNRAKLSEAEHYFNMHEGRLIILDEIQRMPELFQVLRGVIDSRRRKGFRSGQFLILGSASLDLLQQSSETLAGRIAYKDLYGFTVSEIEAAGKYDADRLWLRGGFPDSFLATSDEASLRWRLNFISTYLERDVPQFGLRIPSTSLRLLWTMLAHSQGGQINIAKIASNLDVAAPTARRYLELLEDLLLIRSLRPWAGNISKRLVKAPKIYIRDSGLTHALLNLTTLDDVLGHPVVGASWEGFVMENLIAALPMGITPWFYRTSAGAEIDLVIEKNRQTKYAIEIKRSLNPSVSKGFHLGCDDIKATKRFIVYPGKDKFPVGGNITAMPILDMVKELGEMG
jgi:uncharacterized protein